MHMCNGDNAEFTFISSFFSALIKIFYKTHFHTDLDKVMISRQKFTGTIFPASTIYWE